MAVCYYGNYLRLVTMLNVCSYVQLMWEFLCSPNHECAEEEEQNRVCLTPLSNTERGAVWVTAVVSHLKRGA